MASQCPLCHAPVKDDFGLQECLSCGAQLLIHMDGHVEYKGADRVEAIDEEDDIKTKSKVLEEQSYPSYQEPVYEMNEGPPPAPPSPDLVPPQDPKALYAMPEEEVKPPPEPDHFIFGGEVEEVSATPTPIPEPEPQAPEEEPEVEATIPSVGETSPHPELTTFDFDSPPTHVEDEATPPPPVYVSASSPSSPDLSDVAAFGNSEMSGGRDGTLRYNFIIEGIDTADVREAFREAITDKKFVWDIDQILKSVRNGKVFIPNVAPTKGYILVTRLRGLPVKIRWEQYAIQQT
jgi:hypothetical protein